MKTQLWLDVTARALRCTLIVLSFSMFAGVHARAISAQRVDAQAGVCKAQGTAARLEMHCPTATVAELLTALREGTGVRSQYAREIASTRVSVTFWRGSLLELLEYALSAFNFALWTDDGAASVPTVSIVGIRGAVEGMKHPMGHFEPAEDPAEAPQANQGQPGRERTMPDMEPTHSSVVVPSADGRTGNAPVDIEQGNPSAIALEPPPDTGALLMPPTAGAPPLEPVPVETGPIAMPGANTQP